MNDLEERIRRHKNRINKQVKQLEKANEKANTVEEKTDVVDQAMSFYDNLSSAEKEKFKKAITLKKARDSYLEYIKYCYPDYIMTRFHKFLCNLVQNIVERVEKANLPNATDEDKRKGRLVVVVSVPPQHGKLIADDTPVLTRNGWKKHGDLVVGDEVINHKGQFVKVVNVFPKYYANRKVVLTNGETILCHENHEWLVFDRRKHKEVVVETKQMEKDLTEENGKRFAYQLPIKDFLVGEEKELSVNPYVLGAWLGDGRRNAGEICSCKEDIAVLDECRKYYPNGSKWKHKTTGVITYSFNNLVKDLHTYNMCFYNKENIKVIPQEYLTSSINQRLELLAGLLDTDGYLNRKTNRYTFTTCEETLKDTFVQLVSTFGWRTTVFKCKKTISTSGIVGKKDYYQVCFNPTTFIPCRLARKQLHKFSKQRKIAIKEIKEIEHTQGNCIQVEGGIYLVGETLIPTHNSETITKSAPSWFIGRNPDIGAMLTAYNDDLAEKFGDANREKTRNFGKEIFGIEISETNDTKTLYNIKGHRGFIMARGIQAGLTGNGGGLIIVDDPYKNDIDAFSPSTRQKIYGVYQSSVLTRLRGNGTALIIIQTRWHEDDLAGIVSKEPNAIVINIPCVCEDEKHDPLGRKLGETLCPELGFDTMWAETRRRQVGEKVWNALYQGHPTIDGGEVFTRQMIKHYTKATKPVNFEDMTISCDLSFGGKGKNNDPCAIQVWGRIGANHYLVYRYKKRLTFVEMCEKIKSVSSTYPQARKKIVERKANGQAVIDTLNSEIGGFVPYDPKLETKISRANSVVPLWESGNVFLPDESIDPTITEFEEELMKFPNSEHDDEVDAMTQYLITWNYKGSGRVCVNDYYSTISDLFRGIKV